MFSAIPLRARSHPSPASAGQETRILASHRGEARGPPEGTARGDSRSTDGGARLGGLARRRDILPERRDAIRFSIFPGSPSRSSRQPARLRPSGFAAAAVAALRERRLVVMRRLLRLISEPPACGGSASTVPLELLSRTFSRVSNPGGEEFGYFYPDPMFAYPGWHVRQGQRQARPFPWSFCPW